MMIFVIQSVNSANTLATDILNLGGVLTLSNTTSYPVLDQLYYKNKSERLISENSQQLRLISEGEISPIISYEFHVTSTNRHINIQQQNLQTKNIYRVKSLQHNTIDESGISNTNRWSQEIDRLALSAEFSQLRINAGRQPISWGSGRFWQPLDVFGAFSAIDIEREFKPGIDLIALDYYPSHFSNLTLLYTFSPSDDPQLADSQGLRYQTQIGEQSAISLMLANITDNLVLGGSFETDWIEAGWRFEGIIFEEFDSSNIEGFFIVGVDYQLKNETLIAAEYYYNSSGASTTQEVGKQFTSPLVLFGLQKQLSSQLFGLSLQNTLSPLVTANYTLLTAYSNDSEISTLHQLAGIISLSNESELRLTLLLTSGEKLSDTGSPQSEFGHIPIAGGLKYKYYF